MTVKWAVIIRESFRFFFIEDFVTDAPEPTGKNYSESCSKVKNLNEFIPICRIGNFHRSLSDINLYRIRSRSWAPELISEIANSKKLLDTRKFARNIIHSWLNAGENLKDFWWLLISLLHCMSGMTVARLFTPQIPPY